MGTLELIKVEEREGRQIVSARELYKSLGYSDGQFSRWSKSNITENPFAVENEDWVGFDTNVEGNHVIDYALVIHFAKKLAMMSKTDVGNRIRDYFIECEKAAKSNMIMMPDFTNPAEAAIAWAEQYRAKEAAMIEAKLAQDNVKRLIHDSKTYTMGEIAKELNIRSAKELNKILESKEIQYKQNNTWLFYAKYADMGYTSIKQIELDNGHICYDRRLTAKGRDFILSLFNKD